MKRSPLKRGPGPRRKSRVRAVNAKRRKQEHERAYGGPERLAFVKSLACIVAGRGEDRCFGPIDVAHVVGGGAGRKSDARFTVPLCRGHHCEQHQYGVRHFSAKYAIDLAWTALAVEALWKDRQRQSAPEHIAPIVARVLDDVMARQRKESA